ncbi:MAG: family 43 glycosylhydrolase [Planctomycetota bacterium]|jgi:hypothetical protein
MRYLLSAWIAVGIIAGVGWADASGPARRPEYTAYLMAYFGPQEKLFYAVSDDARQWEALNGGKPVFDAKVRLRDPFVNRVQGTFHLVHTKGWDHPTIFHWESNDLIHWTGGPVDVVEPAKKRAWAPEFLYVEEEDIFYVYWASIHDGHNTMHYVTTKDWTDIRPGRSAVWYDIGIHDIDLTIVEHHADDGYGKEVFDGQIRPMEGPEVIRLIGQEKWYIYGDPFRSPLQAWKTTDFVNYSKIAVSTPDGAKHCSMIPITAAELKALRVHYPRT